MLIDFDIEISSDRESSFEWVNSLIIICNFENLHETK